MKKLSILLISSLLFINFFNLFAEEKAEREPSFSVTLNQDPLLGFYPGVSGSIPIGETTDFTFYGTFWTQDELAGKQGGLNLLTEFGFGLNFILLDGNMNINPVIGFGHGNYQSGGGRAVVGDNIVPSLYMDYTAGDMFFSFSTFYDIYLRKEAKNTPLVHLFDYVFKANYNFSKYFNAGVFVDHYLYADDKSFINPNDDKIKFNTFYFAVGPEITINFKENASVTFSLGPDFVDYLNKEDNKKVRDYYKLSTTISF